MAASRVVASRRTRERMVADRLERRVAVILAADAVGYSRLVGEAEEAALDTLRKHRQCIDSLIADHRGRVFARGGDSVVAEFASAVEAVRCAVEIQRALGELNRDLPEQRRMHFRIGINLGDLVIDGEDLLGDGVNVAARLETEAEAGGILVSASLYDQVRDKVDLDFEDVGELSLKNIRHPVRAYRVSLSGGQKRSPSRTRPSTRKRKILIAAAAVVVAIAVAIIATWPLALRPIADLAGLTTLPVNPPRPARPSIVILPFDNMSGDPDQEYFSDGITEDLTTDLSKNPDLFVISRGSAFTYKDKAVKPQEVGRQLGVGYVLEGSVRKAGDRIRVNAQLLDTSNGFHVWGQRYDRKLDDIFQVQSEITDQILTELLGEIRDAEMHRLARRSTTNLEAYDAYLRGSHHFEKFTREDHREARRWLERALQLDPSFATARALLGNVYVLEYALGWNRDAELLEKGESLVHRAIEDDPNNPSGHTVMANVLNARGEWEKALAEADRAMELRPNFDVPYLVRALSLLHGGRPLAALRSLQHGMRLNPKGNTFDAILGMVNFRLGRRRKAVEFWEASRRENEMLPPRLGLVISFVEEGQLEEAREIVAEILEINPELTAAEGSRVMLAGHIENAEAALRQAGLP